MSRPKRPVRITANVDYASLPDPLAANYFQFSRLGEDYAMQVGWINVPQAVQILEDARNSEQYDAAQAGPVLLDTVPTVTHHFMMSKTGFLGLYRQITNIADELRKQGHFPRENPEGEGEA